MFCGHLNLLLAYFSNKNYFPLRSYLILFNDSQITNLKSISKSIYNLAGYKAIININIPYKLIDDLFFIVISTILIILFFIGYKAVQSNKITQSEIIKWGIVFSVLMTISIPSHSADLYGYIARGAQQSLYNQNPYLEAVSKIKDYHFNPMFCNFMWQDQPATYGPVFIFLTKTIVYLSSNNFFISAINFKFLNLTFYLLLILFVLKLNQIKDLYLISWNPLILIQGLWNCHNDLISGVFIFFGVYMILKSKNKNKYFWGMFSLIIAAGIKYVSILVIPLIIFYLLQKKSNGQVLLNIFLGLCSGLLLTLIFSIDYLSLSRHISIHDFDKLLSNIGLMHKSLIATIFTLVKYFCKWFEIRCDLNYIQLTLKAFFYSAFVIFYLTRLLRKKTDLAYEITLILFIFFGFVLAKFHSWYLLNIIVLIPFLEKGMFKNILVALSLSHVYAITFLDQAKILNYISMTLIPALFVFLKERDKDGSGYKKLKNRI